MAAVILLLDVGRAAAVAFLAQRYWGPAWVPWAGLALIMGNHFPCFHGFRGGKGVANHLGFYAVLLPAGAGLAALTYLVMFALVRIPFIGSFGMIAVLTGFGVHRWADHPLGAAAVVITALCIVWFHRANIAALVVERRGGA
jgi:glycerol-3-phosphate acyltransferase PlsY